MVKSRLNRLFISLSLVIVLLCGFIALPAVVMAQDATSTPTPTPAPEPKLTIKSNIPSYSDDAGTTFNFDVTLEYTGTDRITVNLTNSEPQDWFTYIQYLGKQVNSIDIGPAQFGSASASFTLYLAPDTGKIPDPGDYTVDLRATSGKFDTSITLKANVKAKYSFSMFSETGRLSTVATAGEANHYTINLQNLGSVPLENVTLNSTKPTDWVVTFSPEKIDSLGTNQTSQVDVVITPPSGKTIAGDYMVTLRAMNENVNDSMDVRVTAQTPSIWGWVGIIIVVVVIAGIVVLFLKLGRR